MVQKLIAVLATTFMATAAAANGIEYQPLEAVPVAAPGGLVDETPRLWFVELSGAPTSEGGSDAALEAEHQGFRDEAARGGIAYGERRAFRALFNGFSVAARPFELGKLRRLPGVKSVAPVVSIPVPEWQASGPELFTAIAMTGADVAHSQLGITGRGVKVGIIDTGTDYDNADLGGDGVPAQDSTAFPNQRVKFGWDFVGDAFNADAASPDFNLTMTPDGYPDDCNGHGTHVSGIVGASGVVTGVAPDATIGAYRVFGCAGSTTADVMIAAMERALQDGMDVVNISIGSAFTWPQYPTALAANRLARKGVVVVASIGNSGDRGLYSASSPGLGKEVIGVASFENTHAYLPYFSLSPDGLPLDYRLAVASPTPPTSGTFPLARTGTTTTANDACAPLPAGSLAGKVALVRRGTCGFFVKAANAQSAGAVGVVLYNSAAGPFNPTVAGSPAITIPVVAITGTYGAVVDARIAAGPTDLTWPPTPGSFVRADGGLISYFSSHGLSPDLDLKPDLGAPGGGIYSTVPLEQGGHAAFSGTSMASPHVAGAVALLLQARPHTEADEVRDLLQNTAEPKLWSLGASYGILDGVARQGAGLVRIDEAIRSRVHIEPAKLALGEGQAGPARRELELENHGGEPVTYDLSWENTVSVVGTFAQEYWDSDAAVTFDTPSVTVPAHEEAEVHVTITPPTYPDKGIYGGYLVFTPRGGGAAKRVPYAGFVGDYQSIQVLAPTIYGLPYLFPPLDGVAYTMVGDDIPFFAVHLDHQSRRFDVDVHDLAGRLVGQVSSDEYLPRNSGANGYFLWTWDGVVTRGRRTVTVADGDYVARISVLKALGHPFDPADWETWTSPVITIHR